MGLMREKIFSTTSSVPLNGVLTLPDGTLNQDLGLVILNSGFMHHVGTSRVSVEIARAAGAIGIPAVRFDFSGIGDSAPRPGGRSFSENAVAELAEVMDEMSLKTGTKRFVLFGLCSGADMSFKSAQTDERVCGIVQIDPYLYRNKRWYLRHLLKLLSSADGWKRLLGRFSGGTQDTLSNVELEVPQSSVETADDAREIPPRDEVAKGYQAIISRGCSVLVFVTGGQIYTYNYKEQFNDVFSDVRWGPKLSCHFFPEAEHTLPEPAPRRILLTKTVEWIKTLAN